MYQMGFRRPRKINQPAFSGDDGQTQIISIVRRPEALAAVTMNETGLVPLAQLKSANYPGKPRLEASWQYLGRARAASADTLYHVLVVLLETVPDTSPDYRTAPIDPLPAGWIEAPVSVRPTAANPRAFKGTRFQPPKARLLPEIDLRPHLCHARTLTAVVSPLRRYMDTVRHRLARAGYSDAALQAVEEELSSPCSRRFRWRPIPSYSRRSPGSPG